MANNGGVFGIDVAIGLEIIEARLNPQAHAAIVPHSSSAGAVWPGR